MRQRRLPFSFEPFTSLGNPGVAGIEKIPQLGVMCATKVLERVMARRIGIIFCLLSVLCAFGCAPEPDVTNQVPVDQYNFAVQFMEQIRSGAIDAAMEHVDPTANQDNVRAFLQKSSDNFPKGEVRQIRPVAWSETSAGQDGNQAGNASGVIVLRLRYVLTDTDALDTLILMRRSNQTYVVSLLSFQPLTDNDIVANSFFAPGKSIVHFLYFIGALAVLIFNFVTLYFCVRASYPRWRWRWIWVVLILNIPFFVIGRVMINWTTGGLEFAPLNLLLTPINPFMFAIKGGMFGPWTIWVNFPLGAIAYWIYRWRHNKRAKMPAPAPEEIVAQ